MIRAFSAKVVARSFGSEFDGYWAVSGRDVEENGFEVDDGEKGLSLGLIDIEKGFVPLNDPTD